jgi:hypothetical protein
LLARDLVAAAAARLLRRLGPEALRCIKRTMTKTTPAHSRERGRWSLVAPPLTRVERPFLPAAA